MLRCKLAEKSDPETDTPLADRQFPGADPAFPSHALATRLPQGKFGVGRDYMMELTEAVRRNSFGAAQMSVTF